MQEGYWDFSRAFSNCFRQEERNAVYIIGIENARRAEKDEWYGFFEFFVKKQLTAGKWCGIITKLSREGQHGQGKTACGLESSKKVLKKVLTPRVAVWYNKDLL